MNATADKDGKPSRKRLPRRAGCLFLLAVCGAVLAAWAALWSGAPQRWSIKKAGEVLGAELSGTIGLVPGGVRVSGLTVREPGLDTPPLLAVENLELAVFPGLPRAGKRFLPALSVNGAALVVDGADPERLNYAFISRFLEKPSSGRDFTPFIPQRVTVEDASVALLASEGRLRLDGIGAEADITGLDHLSIRVHSGGNLALEKAGTDAPLMDREEVALNTRFQRDGASFTVEVDAALSGEEKLRGSIRMLDGAGGWSAEAAVDSIELSHPVWGEMAGAWAPVAFTAVSIGESRLSGRLENGQPVLDALTLKGVVSGLRAGPPETPWLAGDLDLDIGGNDAVTGYSGTVRFGTLPPLTVRASQNSGMVSASAAFGKVSPAEIAGAFPVAAPWTAYLGGVRAWSGDLEAAWSAERLKVSGKINTSLAGGGNAALELDARREAATGDVAVTGTATLDKGQVRAEYVQTETGIKTTATLSGVAPARWWREWTGSPALEPLSLALDGETAITLSADGALTARTSLTAPAPGWAGQKLPEDWPLSLKNTLRWADGALTVDGTAALGGGVEAALTKGLFNTATGRTSGSVSLRVELPPLARLAGFPELWGEMRGGAELRRDAKGVVEADLRVTAESLGYGGQSIPYGMELAVSAPVKLQPAPLFMEMGPLVATLGEDTTLSAARATYGADGAFTASDIVFETGFAPLVAKGWLSAAEGRAVFRCSTVSGPLTAPAAPIEYEVDAVRLVVKMAGALVEGLSVSGQLNIGPGNWSGTGRFKAELLEIAGARLNTPAGDTRWEGRALFLENLALDLFGGGARGNARIGLRETGWPVEASFTVDNLDLDVFTREFKPPSLTLTGRVNGSVLAAFSLDGLTGLAVDLRSDEGFSMNKDMVEQLLVSQYMAGMTGGKQVAEVVRDVLGTAPQRAFDSARLVLGMEDGRIAGYARLESAKLNLTVDIKADPAALLEALGARDGEKAPAPVEAPEKTQYNW